jgi:HSP20 family protein
MLRSMIPWRERVPATFPRFENEMEDLMERFFGNGGETFGLNRFTPSLNVSETDNEFVVSAELPGLKPEEVNVELKEGNLWISGKKDEEKEEEGKSFHRIERRHGEFRRMIQLPGSVDEEKVEAKFENGVLAVTVPKAEEVKPKKIPVKA